MQKLKTLSMKIDRRWFFISLFLMALFMAVILPIEAHLLNQYLKGISAPDTSIFYTAEHLFKIADSLGAEGRRLYIISRIRFDILWPLVYTFFLFTSISLLYRNDRFLDFLLWIIPLGLIFDLLENTIVSLVFYAYPDEWRALAHIAGVMTFFKWFFIFLTAAFLLAGILKRMFRQSETIAT